MAMPASARRWRERCAAPAAEGCECKRTARSASCLLLKKLIACCSAFAIVCRSLLEKARQSQAYETNVCFSTVVRLVVYAKQGIWPRVFCFTFRRDSCFATFGLLPHTAMTTPTHCENYHVMENSRVCKALCCCTITVTYQSYLSGAKICHGLISSCLTLRQPQWYATGFACYLDLCCSFPLFLACEHMFNSVSDNVRRRSASSYKSQLQHLEWLF